MRRDVGVLEPDAHPWQVFFRQTDDGFVNVAQDGGFHGGVFDHFTQDAAVATADDEDGFGVWVRVHGEVCDHFLVAIGQGKDYMC